MRILQVGKYYYPVKGGIETHLRVLAKELQKWADVEVAVAGHRRRTADLVDGIKIERLGVFATLLGMPVCPSLIHRLRDTCADVVHIHLPNPWAVLAYLLSGCKRPLVVTYHSDIVRQSFLEPLFGPFLLKFLERSSAVICSSPNLVQHSCILQKYRDRCIIIPFGIDLQNLYDPDMTRVQAISATYPKPILLSVGRLVYYKGFEYLIRAMRQIEATLIIIGKGPLKRKLLEIAERLGVSDRVAILDQVEDIAPFYHAAELFVLPSIARSEAFGIVQLEAMGAGKPVVNTQLDSGVPFVSQHGITGLTVPHSDHAALAAAINLILKDPGLRAQYGAAAKLRAKEEFTIAKMISRTCQVYEHVTTTPEKPLDEVLSERGRVAHQ